MNIILLKDVKGYGKKGDIVTVKSGYANFLITSGSAVVANSTNTTKLEKDNEKKQLEYNLLIKDMNKEKEKLEKEKIRISVKTGAQDKVFGSVTSKQISTELSKKGFEIDKKKIKILNELNSLGVHNIEIELHKDVITILKIELIKEK